MEGADGTVVRMAGMGTKRALPRLEVLRGDPGPAVFKLTFLHACWEAKTESKNCLSPPPPSSLENRQEKDAMDMYISIAYREKENLRNILSKLGKMSLPNCCRWKKSAALLVGQENSDKASGTREPLKQKHRLLTSANRQRSLTCYLSVWGKQKKNTKENCTCLL